MFDNEAAQIINEITKKIEKLENIKKKNAEEGNKTNDRLEGKLIALENLRVWITMNYS